MPQDPRTGYDGHHRSHQEQDQPVTESETPQSGRRRRALEDDGTGGTRVFDLLSKHGKSPASGTGSHHREPEPPATGGRSATQGSPPDRPPRGTPPERRNDAPAEGASRPPSGRSRGAAPRSDASTAVWTPPGQAAPKPTGRRARSDRRGPAPDAPPPAVPPEPPNGADPYREQGAPAYPGTPERRSHPEPPQAPEPPEHRASGDEATALRPHPAPTARPSTPPAPPAPPPGHGPPAPPAGPPARPQGGPPPAAPQAGQVPPAPHSPPSGQPALGRAATPPPAPPARPGPQPVAGPPPAPPVAPPPAAANEGTRITEALSGSPAEAEATRRAVRPPERNTGPHHPDPEATAQHAPVAARTSSTEQEPTALNKPVTPPAESQSADGSADRTQYAAAVGPASEATALHAPAADSDEEASEPDADSDNDEVRAIDATLARFSAVHDEIAKEEAERRNKFAWLFGKRNKEPELGTDMPFDFVEGGRDANASRMEWKKEQRKQRTTRIGKIVAIVVAIAVFVVTGIGWGAKSWVDSKFREVSSLDPNSASIKDIGKQSGDRNFLLVGSDTRAGANSSDGVGTTEDEPGARADTTMIAHIPADRSRVLVVSFPRDLEVTRPACERWDPNTGEYTGEQVPAAEQVKLNEAYAVGGPKCTTKLIQQISGLSITNFLGIDFQGFKSMVDAVNGVEICTEMPIVDENLGTVLPEAGTQQINGTQALHYVRARKVVGDPTSDYGRMQRQQLFLSALLRKTMSSQVLLNPGKLTGFVNSVSANTFGENVSTDQLLELGQSMQGMDASEITFITVPTTGESNSNGNEELLPDEAAALFRGIIEGAPLSPPSSSSGSPRASGGPTAMFSSGGMAPQARPAPQTAPVDIPVRVFNTTDRNGLAGDTQEKLIDAGFQVAGAEQLDTPAEQTVIKYAPANAEDAKTLAKSIPGAKLVEDPSTAGELRLELGNNFDGTVKPGPARIPDDLSTVNAGKDVCG